MTWKLFVLQTLCLVLMLGIAISKADVASSVVYLLCASSSAFLAVQSRRNERAEQAGARRIDAARSDVMTSQKAYIETLERQVALLKARVDELEGVDKQ